MTRLTPEQERDTAERAQAGDVAARELLILANLPLVIRIATRISFGLSLADRIQDGNIGLITAVDKFNPALGHRFSTYAASWIWQAIRRGASNTGRLVRVPKLYLEMPSARPDGDSAIGRALQSTETVISLDTIEQDWDMVDGAGNNLRWPGRESSEDPAVTAERREDCERVRKRLRRLSSLDRKILRERIGNGRTLKDVGMEIGMSREGVRQHCKMAQERYLQAASR